MYFNQTSNVFKKLFKWDLSSEVVSITRIWESNQIKHEISATNGECFGECFGD